MSSKAYRNQRIEIKRAGPCAQPLGLDTSLRSYSTGAGLAPLNGYDLDAFDEGILLYDRDGFLGESRKKLVEELKEKDVVKTDRWWSFPVKAGEEYTY